MQPVDYYRYLHKVPSSTYFAFENDGKGSRRDIHYAHTLPHITNTEATFTLERVDTHTRTHIIVHAHFHVRVNTNKI